jgi:Derlin-2/3
MRNFETLTSYSVVPFQKNYDYGKVRHCRQLEEGDFRGKPAKFVYMILFGIMMISMIAPFVQSHNFLGSALTFMMTYVWGRRNEDVRMTMLGILTFTAPYLPWVMLSFSFLVGNSITMSVLGILVGHTYYFLEYVYPVVAGVRGWKVKKLMEPPRVLHWICGTLGHEHQD